MDRIRYPDMYEITYADGLDAMDPGFFKNWALLSNKADAWAGKAMAEFIPDVAGLAGGVVGIATGWIPGLGHSGGDDGFWSNYWKNIQGSARAAYNTTANLGPTGWTLGDWSRSNTARLNMLSDKYLDANDIDPENMDWMQRVGLHSQAVAGAAIAAIPGALTPMPYVKNFSRIKDIRGFGDAYNTVKSFRPALSNSLKVLREPVGWGGSLVQGGLGAFNAYGSLVSENNRRQQSYVIPQGQYTGYVPGLY